MRRDPAWIAITITLPRALGFFLVWPLVTTFKVQLSRRRRQHWPRRVRDVLQGARLSRLALEPTLILGAAVTATSMALGGALVIWSRAAASLPQAGWRRSRCLVTLGARCRGRRRVDADPRAAGHRQHVARAHRLAKIGSLYSWWGLIFVMTLNSYVCIRDPRGIEAVDHNLGEATASLGPSARSRRSG
jgi:iron(III) transport system permease protein